MIKELQFVAKYYSMSVIRIHASEIEEYKERIQEGDDELEDMAMDSDPVMGIWKLDCEEGSITEACTKKELESIGRGEYAEDATGNFWMELGEPGISANDDWENYDENDWTFVVKTELMKDEGFSAECGSDEEDFDIKKVKFVPVFGVPFLKHLYRPDILFDGHKPKDTIDIMCDDPEGYGQGEEWWIVKDGNTVWNGQFGEEDEDEEDEECESLEGLKIAYTGVFENYEREEIEELIEENDAILMKSVSKNTDILIVGNKPGLAKVAKAKELGIRMMTEEEFMKAIGED